MLLIELPGHDGESVVCERCGATCGRFDVLRKKRSGCNQVEKKSRQTPQRTASRFNSKIGDELAKLFDSYWVRKSPTCSCVDLQMKLNGMTANQVRAWRELPDLILANTQNIDGIMGFVAKAVTWIPGGSTLERKAVVMMIEKAVSIATQATSEPAQMAPDLPVSQEPPQ